MKLKARAATAGRSAPFPVKLPVNFQGCRSHSLPKCLPQRLNTFTWRTFFFMASENFFTVTCDCWLLSLWSIPLHGAFLSSLHPQVIYLKRAIRFPWNFSYQGQTNLGFPASPRAWCTSAPCTCWEPPSGFASASPCLLSFRDQTWARCSKGDILSAKKRRTITLRICWLHSCYCSTLGLITYFCNIILCLSGGEASLSTKAFHVSRWTKLYSQCLLEASASSAPPGTPMSASKLHTSNSNRFLHIEGRKITLRWWHLFSCEWVCLPEALLVHVKR